MIQCTGLFGLLVLGTMGAAFLKGDFATQDNGSSLASTQASPKSHVSSPANFDGLTELTKLGPELASFDFENGKVFVRKVEAATRTALSPSVPKPPKASIEFAGS